MRETDPLDKLSKIDLKEVVTRHEYPSQSLCNPLQNALGYNLDKSTAYHPQTDGKSESTIKLSRICCVLVRSTFENAWEPVEIVAVWLNSLNTKWDPIGPKFDGISKRGPEITWERETNSEELPTLSSRTHRRQVLHVP
ncbi:hypothetical protein Tco_0123702 [Tanacetum coccineum]